ncbi:MAG: S49 family peptidase [Alteromonadaceae bacterium]|nr:S49 family peptidase [Alteromonadaceae bacterium]
MNNTLSALVAGHLLALDWNAAAPDLARAMPDDISSGAMAQADFELQGGVAVVSINGILTPDSAVARYLGWATYHGIESVCSELMADDRVETVVFRVSSAGGLVMGCADAVAAIAGLTAQKRTIARVDPLATSAAYWLASQCSEVSSGAGGVVGSIGVMQRKSSPVAPSQSGDQSGIYLSEHARAKSPDHMTDEGRALIMADLNAAEAEFHADVARGRGVSIEDLRAALSKTDDPRDGGGTFSGGAAVAAGLVDVLETRSEFMARLMAGDPPTRRPSRSRSAAARARVASALNY